MKMKEIFQGTHVNTYPHHNNQSQYIKHTSHTSKALQHAFHETKFNVEHSTNILHARLNNLIFMNENRQIFI